MYYGYGTVIKGVGGLFTVRLFPDGAEQLPPDGMGNPMNGLAVCARGRGALRRKGELLAGDMVKISYGESAFVRDENGRVLPAEGENGVAIEEILPRKNGLIRPPLANLGMMIVTTAVTAPEPDLLTLDKLLCIAEYHRIDPVVTVTKCDLDGATAEHLAQIYRTAGFPTFCVNGLAGEGVEVLREYVRGHLKGGIAAFSGASGVGKSTLLNRIFPELHLETGEISRKIERGKNTTRTVELYPLEGTNGGYLADTPGFTMLDFERFDFFGIGDLCDTFREFAPCIGKCRYKKCTHTKEEGCAVLGAVREGKIPPSRHESYCNLYGVLKNKHRWDR